MAKNNFSAAGAKNPNEVVRAVTSAWTNYDSQVNREMAAQGARLDGLDTRLDTMEELDTRLATLEALDTRLTTLEGTEFTLTSPDGTVFRLLVADDGVLSTEEVV